MSVNSFLFFQKNHHPGITNVDFMQKKAPKHQKYSPMLRGYDPLCSFAPVCYGSLQEFFAKLCSIKCT